MSFVAKLTDCQLLLPPTSKFQGFIVHLYNWYNTLFGHYLMADKPHFFVGVVWFELVQWPLALLNLYAISNTTCIIYGVSQFSSMVGTLSEMVDSKGAPVRLLVLYFPFMGFGVLTTVRGICNAQDKAILII